jgi:hypothetical protein
MSGEPIPIGRYAIMTEQAYMNFSNIGPKNNKVFVETDVFDLLVSGCDCKNLVNLEYVTDVRTQRTVTYCLLNIDRYKRFNIE